MGAESLLIETPAVLDRPYDVLKCRHQLGFWDRGTCQAVGYPKLKGQGKKLQRVSKPSLGRG